MNTFIIKEESMSKKCTNLKIARCMSEHLRGHCPSFLYTFIEQMTHMAMNAGLIFVSSMFVQTLLNMLIEQTPQIFELTYAGQY